MHNFDNFDKTFNRTRNGIFGMGCFIIVANIILFAAIICGIVYGCNRIREKGLKGCVERVWEGPDTNSVPETTP